VFLRLVGSSFLRRKRRRAVVLAAVALGTSAAAALGDIALDIGDKVGRELNSFGANLVVLPAGGTAPVVVGGEDVTALRAPSYLDAADLPAVRQNFWKNNILAFAPILDVPARLVRPAAGTTGGRAVLLRGTWFDREVKDAEPPLRTGMRGLNPTWSVAGAWPRESLSPPDAFEALAGSGLAAALGLRPKDRLAIEIAGRPATLAITGILTAGGDEDGAILLPIEAAWSLSGLEGRVSRVLVRALTTPESAVYQRLGTNPRQMPPEEFERWTCTPFPSSIAYELANSVPRSEARVIRRVADSEGAILGRISGLMAVIAIMAAIGSALAVTSALSTSVLERRSEIGLLKAMGAGTGRVVGLFLAEAALLGVTGGLLGAYALTQFTGARLQNLHGNAVFGLESLGDGLGGGRA